MNLRAIFSVAAMAFVLTVGLAGASQAEPLQLGKFMKPSVAKSAAAKPVAKKRVAARPATPAKEATARRVLATKKPAARRPAVLAQRRAPPVPAAAPGAAPSEATEAFAAQPPVQVVSADELNDLDRAAGPPTTDGSGGRVQMVAAADYNAIDASAPAEVAALPEAPAKDQQRAETPAPGWLERLWAAINGAFVRIASALWSVVG